MSNTDEQRIHADSNTMESTDLEEIKRKPAAQSNERPDSISAVSENHIDNESHQSNKSEEADQDQ